MPALSCRGQVVVEATAQDATRIVADLFKCIVCESAAQGGVCTLALSGGTTPHLLYQILTSAAATGELPWNAVDVFFGDERDVPHDHVESNYNMAQRTLLDHVPIEPSRIHPMDAAAENIEAAAATYEQMIRQAVKAGPNGVPQFDLVLLGMGADGHTASLFPGTAPVKETKKLVVGYFVPVLGRKRMSVTFPLINAAKNIILLVTGEDKAPAVQALLGDDENARRDLPINNLNPNGGKLMIVMDSAAARMTAIKS